MGISRFKKVICSYIFIFKRSIGSPFGLTTKVVSPLKWLVSSGTTKLVPSIPLHSEFSWCVKKDISALIANSIRALIASTIK